MKVLVVGSGAREHALAEKIAASPLVERVILAPGNDGMDYAGFAPRPGAKPYERWEAAPFAEWAQKAKSEGVGLAVIGPDNALAEGIVDVFVAHGILAFGPSSRAARIESSKSYAKSLMQKARIPTARAFVVDNAGEADRAITELCAAGYGCVVKADGLAFGKGVEVCDGVPEAQRAVKRLFGVSQTLVIEERLEGKELSWFAFSDGARVALWEPARDAKRLLDADLGPNTGGMGAFSPVEPYSGAEWMDAARAQIFEPIVAALREDGALFKGLLFAGLMVSGDVAKGPRACRFHVLEFNARFGDPETQALLARFQGDLVPWLVACAKGDLRALPPRVPFEPRKAVYVVAASPGYPDSAEGGRVLQGAGLEGTGEGYFFAGVKKGEHGLENSGGRVYGALGVADQWIAARTQAYERLSKLRFDGMQIRTDIAEGAS